ncbi:unnamed protein product [Schistosoma curassoni]|nr:unnamed protein product [Schistosoma curassoni]
MDMPLEYVSVVLTKYNCTENIQKLCALILRIILIIKSEYVYPCILLCRYSLFQLVVTDNCGRGRTVMFAWTRREKRADVIWILDQFKEIMGDTLLTETFVMDCARCESAAVRMTHGHAGIVADGSYIIPRTSKIIH